MLEGAGAMSASAPSVFVTFRANTVNYGFARADSKAVVSKNVLLHLAKKAAVHMNKSATAHAF